MGFEEFEARCDHLDQRLEPILEARQELSEVIGMHPRLKGLHQEVIKAELKVFKQLGGFAIEFAAIAASHPIEMTRTLKEIRQFVKRGEL